MVECERNVATQTLRYDGKQDKKFETLRLIISFSQLRNMSERYEADITIPSLWSSWWYPSAPLKRSSPGMYRDHMRKRVNDVTLYATREIRLCESSRGWEASTRIYTIMYGELGNKLVSNSKYCCGILADILKGPTCETNAKFGASAAISDWDGPLRDKRSTRPRQGSHEYPARTRWFVQSISRPRCYLLIACQSSLHATEQALSIGISPYAVRQDRGDGLERQRYSRASNNRESKRNSQRAEYNNRYR